MSNHNKKVSQIAAQIKDAGVSNKRLRIYHGPSHTTREFSKNEHALDISSLNEVLEINVEEKYAWVESNVTMDELVDQTLKKDLVPLVVTEFPKITIGGAIQGGAGESSSFKYELVHSTCDAYEIVLGNGEIVETSASIRPDMFSGIPCSYGSLGVLTKAKLRLVSAKKVVELFYVPVYSFAELQDTISGQIKTDADFLDAIMFNKTSGVIMVGRMVDLLPQQKLSTFSKSTDDWFYIHAQKKTREKHPQIDYIPLSEYLFRYNQGVFWSAKFLFDYLNIPVNRLTKQILHNYLNAKAFYKALHVSNKSQHAIVQDFCLPAENTESFLNYLDQTLGAYPLWICPIKGSDKSDLLSPHRLGSKTVINVGFYTHFKKGFKDYQKANKGLETELKKFKGRKVLYAHQYYSPEEFWDIYDHGWYENLRFACHAGKIFPDVYEKTNVNKKYKTQSFTTLIKFLFSTLRTKRGRG